jgi:hypothetical protein
MDFLITGRMQMTDRSTDIAMRVYQVLAWCFFLGVLVQVTLAGVSIFVDGTRWQLHRNVGHAFSLPLFTMLLLAVLARLPRRYIGYAAVAVTLMMVQGATAALGGWIAVAHPANALLIFWLSLRMIRADPARN